MYVSVQRNLYLIYTVELLTLSSEPTHCNSCLNEACLTHMYLFSVGHVTAFLHLEILGSTVALWLVDMLNSENHHEKAQICEKCSINTPQKGYLLTV